MVAHEQDRRTGERVTDVARWLLTQSFQPVPLPFGRKSPSLKDWPSFRCLPAEIDCYFRDDAGVGVLLGEASRGLTDADLDCWEAIVAADVFLPPTGMVWGRASKRRSHRLYVLDSLEGARETKFSDPGLTPARKAAGIRAMICEIRLTGQTVAPGSTNLADGHPELVAWDEDADGEPARITFAAFRAAMGKVAASVTLARLWVEGMRHQLALPLAGFLYYGGMSQADAETLMRTICRIANESEADTENRLGCVRDTYRNAQAGTFVTGGPTLEDLVGSGVVNKLRTWLDLKKRTSDIRLLGPDGLPLAHDGDAERFIRMFGEQVLFCVDENRWYLYDGVRWVRDTHNQVRQMMKQVATTFRTLIANTLALTPNSFGVGGVATLKDCVDWSRSMGNDGHISAALNSAASDPQIAIIANQFDTDPLLFNLLDYTLALDLQTGEHQVRLHRAEDYLRKVADAEYAPDATDPRLDAFRTFFVPVDDHWTFIEDGLGQCLHGLPKRDNINLIGETNTGKSMLLAMLKATFGDYATSLTPEALKEDEHGGDRPRSDLLDLHRMRLVTMPEVGQGAHFGLALYKSMFSGGDARKARGQYERDQRKIDFTHILWASGNREYGLKASDDAAYERAHFVPFDHQMPQGDRDDREEQATVTSRAVHNALLAAALRGFARVMREQRGRLVAPASISDTTGKVRAHLNPYTAILLGEEGDGAGSLLEFTGNPQDGVVASEAWLWAKWEREQALRSTLRKQQEEKDLFRAAMVSAGAHPLGRVGTRFGNRESWAGVRWVPDIATCYSVTVTLPDWTIGPDGGEVTRQEPDGGE